MHMDTPSRRVVGDLATIRPAVNFANRHTAAPGQTWGPRTIPDWQLVYVLNGQAELELGGASYRLQAHDCAYYGPDDVHRLVSSVQNPFTFCSIHFRWDSESPEPVHPLKGIKECQQSGVKKRPCSDIVLLDGHETVTLPAVSAYRGVQELFLEIVREYQDEAHGYTVGLRGLMLQLLTYLIREIIRKEPPEEVREKIAPALRALVEQPERLFTSTELAWMCSYHPTYFAHVFQQATGTTPRQFQIRQRIERAKHLLLTRASVENIADQLGYATVHYFSRQFKDYTGLTPTEFRRSHHEL